MMIIIVITHHHYYYSHVYMETGMLDYDAEYTQHLEEETGAVG